METKSVLSGIFYQELRIRYLFPLPEASSSRLNDTVFEC